MNRRLVIGLSAVIVAVGALWYLRRGAAPKPTASPSAPKVVAAPVLDLPPGERSAPIWFVQRGAKARRIAGHVRFAGAPAVGATVALRDQLTRGGAAPAVEVTSGKDGDFDFGPRTAQRYLVVARAPGKTAAALAVDLRDPTEQPAPDQLVLELGACDNVLFGTVNDSSGGVIAGAHLMRMEQGLPGAGAESDAKGHYELCVPPGRSPIEVVADGYGTVTALASARGRRQHDFALSPEATITGTVLQLDTGAPVAGALVRLETAEGMMRRGSGVSTIADATGQFRFAGVAAGAHRLSASAELLATPSPIDVTVEAGRSSEVTLRLRGVSRLSGVVTAGGKPVAGATITAGLGERSRQSAPALTQADGSFVLERVPRGAVAFDVEDHEVLKPKGITVNQPELGGLIIEVANQASIAGRILRQGAPVAGADVSAGGRRSYSEDVSAPDGSYTLRGLEPGSYQVSANSDRLGASGLSTSVTIGKGEQRTGVDVELADAASIAGVVVEDSGAPVAGATVRFAHTERPDFGTDETGPDGSFRAASLAGEGTYRVIVSIGFGRSGRLQPADAAGFPDVQVAERTTQVTGVRLVVHRGHNVIAGTVLDGAGAAVPDVRVSASRSDGARGGRFGAGGGGFGGFGGAGGGPPGFGGGGPAPTDLQAITGTDGAFTLSDLDDGTYTLQARAGDGSSATAPDVTAGTKDVKIALDAAGGIDGTLNGFQTPPDVVVARADRPGGQNHPQADAQSFHARGLAAGTYSVSASNDSEGDSAKIEVQAGKIATVTLTSHGTAQVTVHVSDWKSHAPASGLSCQFVLGSGDTRGAQTVPGQAFTDDSGRFTELVPAGDAYVTCAGDERFATAVAKLTLTGGKPVTAEVLTVARRPGGELANLGAQLDPSQQFVARVAGVRPGGAAGKAGLQPKDTVVSVDGAPVGALGRAAVEVLIRDRPAGAGVKLGVDRDGKPVDVEVTLDPPGGR